MEYHEPKDYNIFLNREEAINNLINGVLEF